jgi:hypothetical protein
MGIDYARLLDAAHQAEFAQKVNYAALTGAEQTAHDPANTHCPSTSTGRCGDDRPSSRLFGFTPTPFGRDLAPGRIWHSTRATTHRPSLPDLLFTDATVRIGVCHPRALVRL